MVKRIQKEQLSKHVDRIREIEENERREEEIRKRMCDGETNNLIWKEFTLYQIEGNRTTKLELSDIFNLPRPTEERLLFTNKFKNLCERKDVKFKMTWVPDKTPKNLILGVFNDVRGAPKRKP